MKILTLNTHSLAEENATEKMELFAGVLEKDVDKVAELPAWKAEGALGLLKKDGGIQAVYGPKADVLKSDINDIL